MLVVIVYWGGCDYNRRHVPLLPVSPFSINCNRYLFFIALYWYIFVMLINPQFSIHDVQQDAYIIDKTVILYDVVCLTTVSKLPLRSVCLD